MSTTLSSRLQGLTGASSRKTLLFLALALLWYTCSFLSASTSKALLSGKKVKIPITGQDGQNTAAGLSNTATTTTKLPPLFPYPVSLTALQFFFVFSFSYLLSSPLVASFVYRIILRRSSVPRDPNSGRRVGLMSTLIWVDGARLKEMVGLSMFSVTGHILTSAAIQMVPVSTVHTVKALSPLFTVLSYVFILRISYPLKTYLSLLPLTLGVIFACSGLSSLEGPKALPGVFLSVGSTIVFVAQNLWTKKLLGHALSGGAPQRKQPATANQPKQEIKLDKLNILFWSSGVSFLLMLPLVFWSDLPKMAVARKLASHVVVATADTARGPIGSLDRLGQQLHSNGQVNGTGLPDLHSLDVASRSSGTTGTILRLLFSNGLVHFSQSLLAFSVLGLTSPVTYSIASLFKRVFVICFAILWFGQTVSRVQWIGIGLTFTGLWMYNDSKSAKGEGNGSLSTSEGKGLLGEESDIRRREEDAAMSFGMDRSSRRRTGVLPLTGASAGPGPIWKNMSSNLGSSQQSATGGGINGSAGSMGVGYGPPPSSTSISIPPPPPKSANGYAVGAPPSAVPSTNGYAHHHAEVKEGPKMD